MKAARYYGPRDVRVESLPDPHHPGPGEVLVAPRRVGICGTDLHEYVSGPAAIPVEPHPLTGASLPQVLGHELAGDVVAIGEGVTAARVGDRVSVMPLLSCGRCPSCRVGLEQHCAVLGAIGLSSSSGGMAELARIGERQLVLLPDDLTYEQGALLEPAAVAVSALDSARIVPGSAVFITGAGPIGALVALYAQAGGCEVVVFDPRAARAERLRGLGVHALDPDADVLAEAKSFRHDYGYDVAVECSGAPEALAVCIAAVRPRGRVVQIGLPHSPVTIDAWTTARKEVRLLGSWCYPVRSFERVAALVSARILPVEQVIDGQIELEEIAAGLETLLEPTCGLLKVLVRLEGECVRSNA